MWNVSYSQNGENQIWKSDENIFCVEFNNDWILKEIPSSDFSKKNGIDIINKSKSAMLKLRISMDEEYISGNDERYFEKTKTQLLGKNAYNKLALEEDKEFKDIMFHKMLFYLDIDGRNDKKTIYEVYLKRLGNKFIEIHYYYILDIYDGWLIPPTDLTKLINQLKIEI